MLKPFFVFQYGHLLPVNLVVILCIAIIAIVSAWAGATLFTVTRRLPRYSE
jgi:hypothetical protein